MKLAKVAFTSEQIADAKIEMHKPHLHFVDHIKPLPAPEPEPVVPKKLTIKQRRRLQTAPARAARQKKVLPK